MLLIRASVAISLLLLTLPAASPAQQPAPLAGRFEEQSTGARTSVAGLTRAELAEWNAAVERIAAVLRAHPEVSAPPAGICVRLSTWTEETAPGPWATTTFGVSIPERFDGRTCSQTTTSGVEVRLNDAAPLLGGEALIDPTLADPEEIYLLPPQVGGAGPVMRYTDRANRWVVLARGHEPLMVAVSTERYLLRRISELERSRADVDAVDLNVLPDVERWRREERPKLEAELQASLRAMQGVMPPEEIERARKSFEEMLTGMEAALRQAAAQRPNPEAARTGALGGLDGMLDELRAALERLSPEARRAPACLDPDARGVVDLGTCRTGNQWVSVNPRYFDPSLPKSAVQLILIRTPAERHPIEDPKHAELRWRIFDSLDYAALTEVLRR